MWYNEKMNKININFFFLFIFLVSIFFPLKSLSAGTYQVCPRAYPVYYKCGTGESVCYTREEVKKAKEDISATICVPANTDRERVSVCYEGLVPCGLGKTIWEKGKIDSNGRCAYQSAASTLTDKQKEGVSCQFCHFFVMMNGIISFVLINIVPYVAVLMLVVGGGMFYFAGGSASLLQRGKDLMKNVIWGLVLIYGSYILVGLALAALGVTNISLVHWANQGVFSINCMIR